MLTFELGYVILCESYISILFFLMFTYLHIETYFKIHKSPAQNTSVDLLKIKFICTLFEKSNSTEMYKLERK